MSLQQLAAASSTSRKALVVEDNAPFRRLIEDAIAALDGNWSTQAFVTGREAIDALTSGALQPGLVLVDLGLPDISGNEVIRAARAACPAAPVLVVSVMSGPDAVLEAIRLGARGYLQKGDSALSLSAGLRGVLAGEYPISPSLARYLFRLAHADALRDSGTETGLSARELELLQLLGRGFTYEESARRMEVSLNTVRSFTRRIYLKLEVGSRGEALAVARERGFVP